MCPDIVTIPFEYDLYRKIAAQFYSIVLSHADFLQGAFSHPSALASKADL